MTDNCPDLDLSIVSTLYRSEAYLDEFCRRAVEVARAHSSGFEVILVNDGSPDNSLARALQLQKEIPELTVIDLSRNFGHHPAILAGLRNARGKKIFLIDCDLEEEPEWLAAFQERMQTEKADVIFGQQVQRKGKFAEQVTGGIFYKLFNVLSATKLPVNFVTARLMSSAYVQALLGYRERELFLGGVFVIAGFKQVAVPITKGSRKTTSYSLARRVSLFVNALTSFTTRPLHIVFTVGSLVTFVAFVAFCFILYRGLRGETLIGWASVMATIWFFGGLIMISLGIIGIYVAKVLIEVKQRPPYTVRAVYRTGESSRAGSNDHGCRK
jgi:putative glycosyltransferase